ncbi:MAG: hypothetical protein AAFY28_02135 [Actinomycetota bacterium]
MSAVDEYIEDVIHDKARRGEITQAFAEILVAKGAEAGFEFTVEEVLAFVRDHHWTAQDLVAKK